MDEDYAIAFWQCVVRNCNSAEVRCFCLLDVKYNALSILSPLLLSLSYFAVRKICAIQVFMGV